MSRAPNPLAEAAAPVVEEKAEDLPERADKLAELGVSPTAADASSVPVRLAALGIARVVSIEEGRVDISVGGRITSAEVDATVHLSVLRTAESRGEPVLVEQRGEALVIVGALRTQPTPGVDQMETITLEADRIELKGKEEVALSSGVAAIALRAVGEVETYAERILSRAESVHKIIGRMLRLN